MRKLIVLCALLLAMGLAGKASATLIYYDAFSYDATGNPQLPTAAADNSKWHQATAVGVTPKMTSPGMTYTQGATNLQTAGNAVAYDGSGSPNGVAFHPLGTPITSGTVYYSVLLNVTATTVGTGNGFATGTNTSAGSFMMGFEQNTAADTAPVAGDSGAVLLIRSGDGTQTATTYNLGTGVTATAGATTRIYNTTQLAENTTMFLVLSYTFNTGSTHDDVAKLYVNPTLDSSEGSNVPHVTVARVATVNDLSQLGQFFFRNNTVEPDALQVDELRIGTTWEDVFIDLPGARAWHIWAARGRGAFICASRTKIRLSTTFHR